MRGLVLLGEVVEEDEETGPGEQVHPGLLVLAHLLLLVLYVETKRSSSAQEEKMSSARRLNLVFGGGWWCGDNGEVLAEVERHHSLAEGLGIIKKKKKKHTTLD